VWALERQAGVWGIRLSDRLFRFVGFSAVLHAVLAPVTYMLWIHFVRSGELGAGNAPLVLWLVPLAYVGAPIVAGTLVGIGTRARKGWTRVFTGPDPAPRAWDYLFSTRPDGWVRLRLKSGVWLGGAFATMPDGSRSYAAGYPEDQDLYLVEAVEVDPKTGSFVLDEEGKSVSRGSAILIRWERSSISTSARCEVSMANGKNKPSKQRETHGGYPAGDTLVSELKPPPPGPAPGATKPDEDSQKK
jgi:hypothetical protein